MLKDEREELTPGSKEFWDDFYSNDGGRLHQKNWGNRRAKEIADEGSLMDHYEWFMQFDLYTSPLRQACSHVSTDWAVAKRPLRVLHVGCGNSDFCDRFAEEFSSLLQTKKHINPPEVLNVDICSEIILHLRETFPGRLYAVADCCNLPMTGPSGEVVSENVAWFTVADDSAELASLAPASVDIVFDKGTSDALLSAFPGELNPNLVLYAEQALKSLKTGGVAFIISINTEDILGQYFLCCTDGPRSFSLVGRDEIMLDKRQTNLLRVETLGSRYNCFFYKVVSD